MDSFLSTNIGKPLHTNLSLSTIGNTVRKARYSKESEFEVAYKCLYKDKMHYGNSDYSDVSHIFIK